MKKEGDKKDFELMAPAGDFSTLTAACKAGADAVYFGVHEFSMRTGKKNFKISDLSEMRKIVNSYPRKPKLYLTLNTIVYDEELKKVEDVVKKTKDKVDAIICWDLAVIELCRKYGVPFFISTQSSVANTKAAEFYRDLGAKRIVLARELTIRQIEKIAQIRGLEVEVFAHGAMCVSFSGRCFVSQFLFESSANRGKCLHPCRRSYIVKDKEKEYELELAEGTVMSAKDLCTLSLIERIKKAGVKAFKIEGRNRDARYVEKVVKAYRRALDSELTKEEAGGLIEEVKSVYNKGFSTGFYLGRPTGKDFANTENSAATTYKEVLGRVTHFYPKIGVALVKLTGRLCKGEKIVFIGKSVGSEEMVVEEMERDKRKVEEAEKGDEVGIKTGFKTRKGDEVYKIKERGK